MSMPFIGQLPKDLWGVLNVAYQNGGVAIQSDFARACSTEVALAASLGWLSTISPDCAEYGRTWRLTLAGQVALQHKEHLA